MKERLMILRHIRVKQNYYKCLLVCSYSITVIGQHNKLLYQFIPESLYSALQRRRNRTNIAEQVWNHII